MKCPRCARNQKRGKEGMVCKSCSYEFIFDPKRDRLSSSVNLNDHVFRKIINDASASGTYHFTGQQLFSSARHFGKGSLIGCGIVTAFLLFFSVVAIVTEVYLMLFFSGGLFLLVLIWLLRTVLQGHGPPLQKWQKFVKTWLKWNSEIPGLIESPALSTPPPQWKESDIYDYGVSGIILCNREEIVDWLVLNQFHTQTNTLILTARGYPSYLSPIAGALLEETPDLPVWLLHDPTVSAADMKKVCPFPITETIDLGLDSKTMSRLAMLKKRFGNRRDSLPLDVIPYRTFSAALTHCLTHGVLLGSVLGANTADSDTDTSFG